MNRIQRFTCLSVICVASCANASQTSGPVEQNEKRSTEMWVASSVFRDGASLPAKFTRDGENISPDLSWGNIPAGTKMLAIVCHDSDSPSGNFTHWVVYNIPAEKYAAGISEGFGKKGKKILNDGVKQGKTDFGSTGYDGAAPPPGKPHRYVFTVYALDTKVECVGPVTRTKLSEKMEGHILGQAQITGVYERK